ncbi:hypothetical protein V6Z12_D05G256500 [Gossypium hirsutum]
MGVFLYWFRRNNYVFNADFMESGSLSEKSYHMREYYLASNHGLVSLSRHTSYKICKLIRWILPDDGWLKIKERRKRIWIGGSRR